MIVFGWEWQFTAKANCELQDKQSEMKGGKKSVTQAMVIAHL